MKPENIRNIFIAAIVCILLGGYYLGKSMYTAFSWTKVEGTVVDLEKHTLTCGKSVNRCYSLVVGYHAGKEYFVTNSHKKYSHDEPRHMLEEKLTLYYSPTEPYNAVLAGSYGPGHRGKILFWIGAVILLIFWFMRKKA